MNDQSVPVKKSARFDRCLRGSSDELINREAGKDVPAERRAPYDLFDLWREVVNGRN